MRHEVATDLEILRLRRLAFDLMLRARHNERQLIRATKLGREPMIDVMEALRRFRAGRLTKFAKQWSDQTRPPWDRHYAEAVHEQALVEDQLRTLTAGCDWQRWYSSGEPDDLLLHTDIRCAIASPGRLRDQPYLSGMDEAGVRARTFTPLCTSCSRTSARSAA